MILFRFLGLFVLIILGDGLSITCPEGFENHNSRCYKVLDVPSSWAEAKVYCSVIGGDLAIIDDANEHGIITGIIQRLHGSNDVHHWLDGSDVLAENEWRWMGHHGGSKPITYTKWNPGQPDNTDSAEHFLELSNFWHGAFNDMRGDVRRGFVCEARYILMLLEVNLGMYVCHGCRDRKKYLSHSEFAIFITQNRPKCMSCSD